MKRFWPWFSGLILVAAATAAWSNDSAKPLARDRASHWAFQPIQRPSGPTPAAGLQPPSHPIDAWVQARLSQEGIAPSESARAATLARRVALDLTGLPPTPEALASFLADPSPDAYERWMERCLQSPHYGERWGRWWLDAARYGDSNGYSIDSPRTIWPYRDWVVRALNADLPFDQFTLWQLAGDLLPDPTPDQMIATGFHRNTQVNHEGGIDTEQFRVESAVDRVNTTATVWLGLTLACAQCHDHKYDPLTQREYYQLYAFFDQQENDGHGNPRLEAVNTLELGSPEERAASAAYRAELAREEEALQRWTEQSLRPRQADWEANLPTEVRQRLKPEIQAALAVPVGQRNEFQANAVFGVFRDQDPAYQKQRQPIEALRQREPQVLTTLVMRERPERRETRLMIKGDFTRPGESVTAGTPAVLPPLRRAAAAVPGGGGLNRLDLAHWLVSLEQPLTARVIMNRVWQVYFGRGLVETENDFGLQGLPPSHPELLDWLAAEFRTRGWSLKAMHRLIVTSATYRQSSRVRPGRRDQDPYNRLLARQNRLRLEAELIRDVALAASGLLERRLGGPPVFPPQPAGLGAFTQNSREWKTSTGSDRYRRALYTWLQRTSLQPALTVFDAPDGYVACTRRLRSNTPLQALTLLNDAAFHEMAQALAERLAAQTGRDRDRLQYGFRACVGRDGSDLELAALERLIASERAERPAGRDPWLAAARVFLNLDETITRE